MYKSLNVKIAQSLLRKVHEAVSSFIEVAKNSLIDFMLQSVNYSFLWMFQFMFNSFILLENGT